MTKEDYCTLKGLNCVKFLCCSCKEERLTSSTFFIYMDLLFILLIQWFLAKETVTGEFILLRRNIPIASYSANIHQELGFISNLSSLINNFSSAHIIIIPISVTPSIIVNTCILSFLV